ncbi:MAG: hypothetical protein JWN93_3972 [Hyphomicrobiales bacterium]|nr:hypothetical protein [Hyphomicrobiales bacterium]
MRQFLSTASALLLTAGVAMAQTEKHDGHHPAEAAQQTAPAQAPAAGGPTATTGGMSMMGAMPEQCRRAMQSMPQECRGMMQLMQGMMVGRSAPQDAAPAPGAAARADGAPHTAEMRKAMDEAHGPMMQAAALPDPDEAFFRGMIPHHQAAIDMAQIVLKHGRDDRSKTLAAEIIRQQAREIQDMQDWLSKHGK